MEAGFIQDIGYGITMQTQWLSGDPEVRTLLGMKNGIKYRMDGIPLISYRCPKCTLIEWYAPSKS